MQSLTLKINERNIIDFFSKVFKAFFSQVPRPHSSLEKFFITRSTFTPFLKQLCSVMPFKKMFQVKTILVCSISGFVIINVFFHFDKFKSFNRKWKILLIYFPTADKFYLCQPDVKVFGCY